MALRFSTAYAALMLACAASALAIPASVTERFQGVVSVAFMPISRPTLAVTDAVASRVLPEKKQVDASAPKTETDAITENAALRTLVVSLLSQLEELKRLNAEMSSLGEVRNRSVPARVSGVDATQGTARQFLSVSVPMSAGVTDRMVVVYPQGLVGRVSSALAGGARVQLTTDRESRVQAAFVRFARRADGGTELLRPKTATAPLVVGDGSGMKIKNLSVKEVEAGGVAVGDWLVLHDPEFPELLNGYRIGRVSQIRSSAPLWAEITVEPPTDLRRLQNVLIVNRP